MEERKWQRDEWKGEIPILYKKVFITSAEILLLYTTPKTLVDAPGTGKVIEYLSGVAFLDHGGTDYTAGGNLVIQSITSNTAVSDVVANTELINENEDTYESMQALSANVSLDVGEGLELTNASAVHATGNGTLVIDIAYRIHDFS